MRREIESNINVDSVEFINIFTDKIISLGHVDNELLLSELSNFNAIHYTKLSSGDILYWALVNKAYTVSTIAYPYVIEDLQSRFKKARNENVKKTIAAFTEVLHNLYKELGTNYASQDVYKHHDSN